MHRNLISPTENMRLRRINASPLIHYRVIELNLIDFDEMSENEIHGAGKRYLMVERKYGKVGYTTVLKDIFSMITPNVKLLSQVVGHKSSKRTVYQVRSGTSINERRRIIFG